MNDCRFGNEVQKPAYSPASSCLDVDDLFAAAAAHTASRSARVTARRGAAADPAAATARSTTHAHSARSAGCRRRTSETTGTAGGSVGSVRRHAYRAAAGVV